jgi:hypothetical protein
MQKLLYFTMSSFNSRRYSCTKVKILICLGLYILLFTDKRQLSALNVVDIIVCKPRILFKCIHSAKLLKLFFVLLLYLSIKDSIKSLIEGLLGFVSCKPSFAVCNGLDLYSRLGA